MQCSLKTQKGSTQDLEVNGPDGSIGEWKLEDGEIQWAFESEASHNQKELGSVCIL